MKTFWFFRLRFRRAYDSAYDYDFRFSLGHKRAYDSDNDSVASKEPDLVIILHFVWNQKTKDMWKLFAFLPLQSVCLQTYTEYRMFFFFMKLEICLRLQVCGRHVNGYGPARSIAVRSTLSSSAEAAFVLPWLYRPLAGYVLGIVFGGERGLPGN